METNKVRTCDIIAEIRNASVAIDATIQLLAREKISIVKALIDIIRLNRRIECYTNLLDGRTGNERAT